MSLSQLVEILRKRAVMHRESAKIWGRFRPKFRYRADLRAQQWIAFALDRLADEIEKEDKTWIPDEPR